MLTVGATDSSDNLWVDSNWGPQTVDLMAPGVAIRVFSDTTVNSGPSMPLVTGTSFAAPMVAGAAALFRSLNPAASAQATVDAVRSSVRVVPGLAGTCVSGGVLDVNNLITP
jgi:subtilisin family serine protease